MSVFSSATTDVAVVIVVVVVVVVVVAIIRPVQTQQNLIELRLSVYLTSRY